jgi:hypothetical protein
VFCSADLLPVYAKEHCNDAMYEHIVPPPMPPQKPRPKGCTGCDFKFMYGWKDVMTKFALLGTESLYAETLTLLFHKLGVQSKYFSQVMKVGRQGGREGGGGQNVLCFQGNS